MPAVAIEVHKLSGPKRVDFDVYRGDSNFFRINVKVPDPITPTTFIPFDISGGTWDADIRHKADDPDPITFFDVTPTEGDTSSIDVSLPADRSALLEKNATYDIEMTLDGQVITLVYGVLILTKDVSRT
jgi:hypothetical protein